MSKRPLEWLEEATPAEIAEAILAIDLGKAAAVAMYLTERFGAEIGQVANQFEQKIADDPVGTIGRAVGGAIRGFLAG